jgi:hypothetical protein
MKVMIGTPMYWPQVSFNYLVSMMAELPVIQQAGIDVVYQPTVGDAVTRQRNWLTAIFLASTCDVLGFWDADTGGKGADVVRMIKSGLPVVCANYPKRDYFFDHPQVNGTFTRASDLRDAMLESTIKTKANGRTIRGMIEIDYGGTGLMVIHRIVLQTIVGRGLVQKLMLGGPRDPRQIENYWRFFHFHVTGHGHPLGAGLDLGEDWNFCDLVRAAGFDVWCDPAALASHAGLHCFEGRPRWPDPTTNAPTQEEPSWHGQVEQDTRLASVPR